MTTIRPYALPRVTSYNAADAIILDRNGSSVRSALFDDVITQAIDSRTEKKIYKTRADFFADNINGGITTAQTIGHSASDDGGGANWVDIGVGPFSAKPYRGTTADGRWWQMVVNGPLRARQFGCKGDNIADDRSALLDALTAHNDLGGALDLENLTYRITDAVVATMTRKLWIVGDNATIRLDRATSVQTALDFDVGQNGFYIKGINIDCSLKSYNGVSLQNNVTGMTGVGDGYIELLSVSNVRRAGTAFVGGFGIWIGGGYNNLTIVRPKILNCRLAAGAGVPASIGIHGLAILNTATAEARHITIVEPYIDHVGSEDLTYYPDQDGIQIFKLPPSGGRTEGSCLIIGGVVKNCFGRSIKIAALNAKVIGTHFVRTNGHNARAFVEIDFQYGEGTARDISYFHDAWSAEKIVSASANNTTMSRLLVDGVSGYITPATIAVMDAMVLRTCSGPHANSVTTIRNLSHRGRFINAAVRFASNSATLDEQLVVENVDVGTLGGEPIVFESGVAHVNVCNISRLTAGAALDVVSILSGTPRISIGTTSNLKTPEITMTLSGLTTTPSLTVTARRQDNQVSLIFPASSGTSNATTMWVLGLPTRLRPATIQFVPFRVVDAGATFMGVAEINTDGAIYFYKDAALSGFTASGTKGVAANTITYLAA